MNIEQMNTDMASADMNTLTYRLMNEKYGLPDCNRNYKKVTTLLKDAAKQSDAIFMGVYDDEGELCGSFGITDVVPFHEGRFYMLLWDKKAMVPSTLKFVKNFVDCVAGTYDLRRIVIQTPCQRLCRVLKNAGFKVEGRFRHGYKWNDKYYTLYQLRKLKEV